MYILYIQVSNYLLEFDRNPGLSILQERGISMQSMTYFEFYSDLGRFGALEILEMQ